MSVNAFPITPQMQEFGVTKTALLLRSWDEDEGKLYIEAAVHVERMITKRQCEDLRDVSREASGAAAMMLSSLLDPFLRPQEIHVDVSFGVYAGGDGE